MKHLLTTTAALALSAGMAHASPIPVATLAADFNVIVEHNASTTSEYIGPAMIGGNFTGTGAQTDSSNTVLPIAIPGAGELTVFGNAAGNFIGHQRVVIGGTNGATIIGETSLTVGPIPIDFAADVWAPLTAFSASLGGLTATGGFNAASSSFTGLGSGLNVVDMTAAQLHSATGPLQFSGLGAGDELVVNVSGSSFSNPAPLFGGFARPNVIFNFIDAISVSINNEWWASILAPQAAFSNTAPVDGLVVVSGATDLGELHYSAPRIPDLPPPVPMTAPGGMGILGLGLIATWIAARAAGRLVGGRGRQRRQKITEADQVWPL